jgi:hypothetical protein
MTRRPSAAAEVQPKRENTQYDSGRMRLSSGEPAEDTASPRE